MAQIVSIVRHWGMAWTPLNFKMVGAIIGLLLFVPAPTKCILLTTQSSGQSNKLNSPRMSFSMCSSSERKLVHADWSVTPVQKYSGTRSTTLHDTKNLNIVYVDEHMVVVDKPSGVRCVPGTRRIPSILDDVFNLFGCESGDMDKMVVHRLDMVSTSSTLPVCFIYFLYSPISSSPNRAHLGKPISSVSLSNNSMIFVRLKYHKNKMISCLS